MSALPSTDAWLLTNFPAHGAVYCAAHLHTTPESVRVQYRALRRSRLAKLWPDTKGLWLYDNAKDFTPEACADHLRVPVDEVVARMDLLGLGAFA